RFLVLSAAVAELHDLDWLASHAPTDGSVTIENVTPRWGVLILAGPCAREILARATDADLSNGAFPWLSAREIEVGSTPVRALRVNFVGELGWELHHPVECQVALYEALQDAGQGVGLVDFGLRAMDSLRLEKAYRAWGSDINTEVTPLEAGLDRFVAFDKGDFIGRDALVRQRRIGVRKRLATLEGDALGAAWGGTEAVGAGDRMGGIPPPGGYAHYLGKSLAAAYVDATLAPPGPPLVVEILGERRPARVLAEPPFDPQNHRLRS